MICFADLQVKMSDSTKRCHESPTGLTPGKKPPKKRTVVSGRFTKKELFKPNTESNTDLKKVRILH